jgi:hypothetical protein
VKPTDRLGPEDAKFVEMLGEHYAPTPWSSSDRAAFDAAVRARIAGRGPRLWLAPGLAAAAAALVGLVLLYGPPEEPTAVADSPPSGWEDELFLASDVTGDPGRSDSLPADYQAIASLFLE